MVRRYPPLPVRHGKNVAHLYILRQSVQVSTVQAKLSCVPPCRLHPIAPDEVQDFIRDFNDGKTARKDLLQHCKRELFQTIWALLLDDDFMEAYRHGIVVHCGDGITRRLFPRIFTYSADYPERVLIVTIRNIGNCPCPLCRVHKDNIHLLGTLADDATRVSQLRTDSEDRRKKVDLARSIIYDEGYVPGNERSEQYLFEESLVATENTFSQRFADEFGFDFFQMMTVDVLHEVELGVWKATYTHLVRIMYALGHGTVNTFKERFQHVGNFGSDTIRSFVSSDASEVKNWAARTYEDCLQRCLPCVEDLLPKVEDRAVQDLVFILALWHGLAKLRQHTDNTLLMLEAVTKRLGYELRRFANETSNRFDTFETPKEQEARNRREAANVRTSSASKSTTNSKGKAKSTPKGRPKLQAAARRSLWWT